jgi:hypothetical protein
VASFAAVAAALAPAFISTAAVFDASVALKLIEVLAIIWTLVFAGENVRILIQARLDEFLPLLSAVPRHRWGADPKIDVQLHNVGKGAAVDLDVVAWWKDKDLVQWLPHHLRGIADVLRSGESAKAELPMPWVRFRLEKDEPVHLIFEAGYRDARGIHHRELIPFHFGTRRAEWTFTRVDLQKGFDIRPGGKLELLRKYVAAMEADFDLSSLGIQVEPSVTDDAMTLRVSRGPKPLFSTMSGIEEPVYRIADDVRDFLERKLTPPLEPDQLEAGEPRAPSTE